MCFFRSRLTLFSSLTKDGKELQYFEEETGEYFCCVIDNRQLLDIHLFYYRIIVILRCKLKIFKKWEKNFKRNGDCFHKV